MGGNIACNLHLELLHRQLKGEICNLYSNLRSNIDSMYPCKATDCVARSIGVLYDICNTFEQENNT